MDTHRVNNPKARTAMRGRPSVAKALVARGARTLFVAAFCTSLAFCPALEAAPPSLAGSSFKIPTYSLSWRCFDVGDIDEDGWTDMVLDAAVLECYLSLGDGTFATPFYTGTNRGPGLPESPLTLADLTGDGHLDALTTKLLNRGRGDGTFGPPEQQLPMGDDGTPIVADFNADGIPDLMVAGGRDGRVARVRLGLGGGALDSVQAAFSGNGAAAVARIDSDAFPDLVLWDLYLDRCEVRLGLGNGQFGEPSFTTSPGGRPLLGDLNVDGHVDLVVGSHTLLGNGDGAFVAGVELGFEPVALGDLDADDRPDAVGLNLGEVLWSRGTGGGSFGPIMRLPTGPEATSLRIADLQGDGWPEIVVAISNYSASLAVHANRPGLGFPSVPPRHPVEGRPADLATVDANRDGTPDLVVANRGGRSLSLLIGAGDGTFTTSDRIETPPGVRAIVVADVEGDGMPEAIAACDSADAVTVVSLLPDGRFAPRRDVTVGDSPVDVATGDFDEDGRPEIVVTNRLERTISIVRSSASGELTVTSQPSGMFGYYLGPLAVLDAQGDGHLDIALSWDDGSRGLLGDFGEGVKYGDGSGTFPSSQQRGPVWVAGRVTAVAGADLDADGRVDQFVAAGALDSLFVLGRVALWLRQADGSFTTRTWDDGLISYARSTSSRPSGAAAHDFDGDGFVEGLVSDSSANAVFFLRGHPDGYIGAGIGLGVGDGPMGLAVADFDRDGDADVAVALAGADAVAILDGTIDHPTSVLVSLVDAHAHAGNARLRWLATGAAAFVVDRADAPGAEWREIATVVPDGSGMVSHVDEYVRAGERLGYRLRVAGNPQGAAWGETWIDIPGAPGLALRGTVGNPSRTTIRVAFSLPSAAPATLELFDVTGRRIEAHEVGGFGVGAHTVALGARQALPPGLFLIRLTSQGQSLTAKALLMR